MPSKKTSKSSDGEARMNGQCSPGEELATAREHVLAAAALLRSQGVSELERLAWMLEDTLDYLEQYGRSRDRKQGALPEFPSVVFDADEQEEEQDRLAK